MGDQRALVNLAWRGHSTGELRLLCQDQDQHGNRPFCHLELQSSTTTRSITTSILCRPLSPLLSCNPGRSSGNCALQIQCYPAINSMAGVDEKSTVPVLLPCGEGNLCMYHTKSHQMSSTR